MGVTANGIGERAGNASLHQVVMILYKLYGIKLPRIRYKLLTELRRRVERYTGIPIPPHEPIVGEGVFSHESGIHTAGILIHPAIYQFIPESEVGGDRRFVFGKHTGATAVEYILSKHKDLLHNAGLEITQELIEKLTQEVKEKREKMIRTNHCLNIIKEHYQAYHNLGISEEKLIEIALASCGTFLKSGK